jgi:hypothetical protein
MSILVRFHPRNLTAQQYDEVVRREKEDLGDRFPPDGRDYHVCFGTDGDLRVSEIWDSPEKLQAYYEILMPVIAEVGVELSAEPEIVEVYNIERR